MSWYEAAKNFVNEDASQVPVLYGPPEPKPINTSKEEINYFRNFNCFMYFNFRNFQLNKIFTKNSLRYLLFRRLSMKSLIKKILTNVSVDIPSMAQNDQGVYGIPEPYTTYTIITAILTFINLVYAFIVGISVLCIILSKKVTKKKKIFISGILILILIIISIVRLIFSHLRNISPRV